MAPRKTATKGKGKGKAPVVAGPSTNHVLARPAMKATGAQTRSSFAVNIQRLLDSRNEPTIKQEESSEAAGPSAAVVPADDAGVSATTMPEDVGPSAATAPEDAPNDDTARQLRNLDSVLAEFQELRRSIVNGTVTAHSQYTMVDALLKQIHKRTNRTEDMAGEINQRTDSMNDDLQKMSETVDEINTQTDTTGDSVDKIEETVDKIEETVDNMEDTVDGIDRQVDSMNDDLQTVSEAVAGIHHTVGTTATNVANMEDVVEQMRMENYQYYKAARNHTETVLSLVDRRVDSILTIVRDMHGY